MAAAEPVSPALWLAAAFGRTQEANQLLTGGANIEERGGTAPFQTTPLQVAVYTGHVEVFQLLLDHGADTSTNHDGGGTLLHWAASLGHGEVAVLLLQNGAEISAKTDDAHTPLHLAALFGQGAVARVLLQNGADVSLQDGAGRTALHTAAKHGQVAVVPVLIEHRANVLAETYDGLTPEDLATAHSHHQVVAVLQAEAVSRAKCVAFAMGHQERLGAGSAVRWLDPEVLRMVLERV